MPCGQRSECEPFRNRSKNTIIPILNKCGSDLVRESSLFPSRVPKDLRRKNYRALYIFYSLYRASQKSIASPKIVRLRALKGAGPLSALRPLCFLQSCHCRCVFFSLLKFQYLKQANFLILVSSVKAVLNQWNSVSKDSTQVQAGLQHRHRF